jgi:hypothetical protein
MDHMLERHSEMHTIQHHMMGSFDSAKTFPQDTAHIQVEF